MSNTIRKVLASLVAEIEWCVDPDKLSAANVDRQKEVRAVEQALAEIERLLEEAKPKITVTNGINIDTGFV